MKWLMGPFAWFALLQKMFDQSRIISTIVYLSSIVVTLIVAILTKSVIFTIICLIIQFLALFWYSASCKSSSLYIRKDMHCGFEVSDNLILRIPRPFSFRYSIPPNILEECSWFEIILYTSIINCYR